MRLWIPLKRLGEPRDSRTGPSYCGTTDFSFIVSFSVRKTDFSSLQDNYSRTGCTVKIQRYYLVA